MRNIPGLPEALTDDEARELQRLDLILQEDDGFLHTTEEERETHARLITKEKERENAQVPYLRALSWAHEAERLWVEDEVELAMVAAEIAQAWGAAR